MIPRLQNCQSAVRGCIHLELVRGCTHLELMEGCTHLELMEGCTHLELVRGCTHPELLSVGVWNDTVRLARKALRRQNEPHSWAIS
jgi:hypothetical protein